MSLPGQKPSDRRSPPHGRRSRRCRLCPRGAGGSGDGGGEHAAPPASGAEPPGTPLQEIVRDLFAEAIGVPRTVHADSDFFRLGGHPAAVARLLARARRVLGAGLDDCALHEAPTPARFAAAACERPAAATGARRGARR